MRRVNATILSAADTGSQNGSQIDANQLISGSFVVYFGDTGANGTFKIQASNDPCPYGNLASDFTVTNWVNIPNATASISSGASAVITIAQMSYRWIRAVYTRSSGGSTTVTVLMEALSL